MLEQDCYEIGSLRKKPVKKIKSGRQGSDRLKSKEVLKVRNGGDDKKQEFANKKNDKKNENKKIQQSTNRGVPIFDPYNSYMITQNTKPSSQRQGSKTKLRPLVARVQKYKTVSLSQKLSDIEQTQQDQQQQNDQQQKARGLNFSDYFLTGFKVIKSSKSKRSFAKQNRSLSLKLSKHSSKQKNKSKSRGFSTRKDNPNKKRKGNK